MKRIINITEVVGGIETEHGPTEVCATASANYEEASHAMVVELASFLRPSDPHKAREHHTAAWLPAKQTLKESVEWEDASTMAREIFRSWVHKIRQGIPCLAER